MEYFKIYANDIDEATNTQFMKAISQPYVKRAALMSDAHLGYSLPIGGVALTDDIVVPSWIGFDIGCGVCALPIGCYAKEITDNTKEIFEQVQFRVPTGYNHHMINLPERESYYNNAFTKEGHKIFNLKGGTKQLGTLGGGNHFIEIGHLEYDKVSLVIHSGSRGIGYGIAKHYMKLAHSVHKSDREHLGFHVLSQEGKDYMVDQAVCLEFALESRVNILKTVINVIEEELNREIKVDWSQLINKTHNHAILTAQGVLHRKGATDASEGELGVIPGNMRDGSYIVRGKGNKQSLNSCSHGAGRIYGRRSAKKALYVKDFKETMKGITASVSKATLDESPMAYKNFEEVMWLQKDLVTVVAHIKPIINIKG